ncbi:Astacin (Peptidase M12A) [Parelaphostrongylus tenuis]|uniref:Metalloendopeptidase n=1 Tax=Parelaphostrongylus tenuis TaxID=148309 RepID=A0AAD5R7Z5_PARTN|nr:Astacin (Peptidase M12A) [Parelaphostrongylus tenuis]
MRLAEKAKRVFKKATQIWSSVTCLDFTESSTATDRIQLILASGCWSHLGRIGGVQYMSLGQGCEWVGTAEHELGHALGFHHTQIRHDRDDFVTIYPDNFQINAAQANHQLSAITVDSLIPETALNVFVQADMAENFATKGCTTLMKWDFCRDAKYEDKLRKLICPKSCGFCC